MGAPRAEPPARILTAGHFGWLATIDVRGVYRQRASHWGCCCGATPQGLDNDVTVPRYPDQSNLNAVLDCAYPGRDCAAMRATHHSLESTPSEPSQPSNLPTCPASPSHFSGPRGLALCVILVEA